MQGRPQLAAAAMLGVGGGLRAFATPVGFAAHGRGPVSGAARRLLFAAGVGELLADKYQGAPSRWSAIGLAPRVCFTGTGGYDIAGWSGAGVGSACALLSAFVGSHLRERLESRPAQLTGAVAEDALSYALVLTAVHLSVDRS